MNYDPIIDVISRTVFKEDNLKYEHSHLDEEIQRNKLSMHIECCVYSGHLEQYLKNKVEYIHVQIPICDKQLYDKIFFREGIEGCDLFLISSKSLPYCLNRLPYVLVAGCKCGNSVIREQIFDDEITQKYINFISYYDICLPYTPYKKLREASNFFNISYLAYDENKGISSCYHPDIFLHNNENMEEWDAILAANPERREALHIEDQLTAIGDRRECHIFRSVYSHQCDGLKQVYDFKNADGLIVMKAIKQLDFNHQGTFKNYAPITIWRHSKHIDSRLLVVPLPGKQIMYNLDKFSGRDTVVICPNLEIADQLQRENKLSNVVYTTFLCNEGCVNQVDFSPLRGKNVIILAVNHSNFSLLGVLRASLNLYHHLNNNEKIVEKQLHVLVAEIQYFASRKYFNLAEYLDYYETLATPVTCKDSIKLLSSFEELEDEYNKVAEHIRKLEELNRPYWYKTAAEQNITESTVRTSSEGEQLMRGVISRGAITFICGQKHIGKTNFTSSLIARLLNTSQRAPEFLKERCWTPCKCTKTTPLKIAYLDYENGKELFERNIKPNFIVPYLPDKDQGKNLIHKDMRHEAEYDYSQEAYFERFCAFLDDIAAKDGNLRQAIDVLVIDTYWSFVRGRDTNFEVFAKLQKRYPQMAIIVQHHLNGKGSLYGRIDKSFRAAVIIELTRDSSESCNLETTFQVTIKNSRLTSFEKDLETFNAHYDKESKHFVVGKNPNENQDVDNNCSYEEYVKALWNHYKTIEYTKEDLAKDLGVSPNTLATLLKN